MLREQPAQRLGVDRHARHLLAELRLLRGAPAPGRQPLHLQAQRHDLAPLGLHLRLGHQKLLLQLLPM
eukprot:1693667-Pyramimonas_sp.AAC.1